MLRGLITVALGIIVMVWPDITLKVLVILVGIWALIEGIGLLADMVQAKSGTQKGLLGLFGLISLVVAFYCLFRPSVAAATVIWFIGIWLIIRAVFGLFAAFGSDLQTSRLIALLVAAVDLALGLIFVIHPHRTANGIAWLLGLFILVSGLLTIWLAFSSRGARKDIAQAG
ncbi:MAG: DUF308 domain-containing protein [Nocardioidaceae bacterium]|nr:MAG: DUF308 domain-containing protein [Nocardioidaceae bacterium]